MRQFSFPKSFINLKTLSTFALTVFIALFFNSIFGRYVFKYSITETFTRAEAEAKLNQKVTTTCFENHSSLDGTVVSYERRSDGQISVAVKFDKFISGKFDKLNFEKANYERCFKPTNQ